MKNKDRSNTEKVEQEEDRKNLKKSMKRNPKKTKFKENTKLEWRNFLIYFLWYYTMECWKQVNKDSFKNLKFKK